MGTKFPAELRHFYLEIGYGFANRNETTAFQRIIDPDSAVDLHLRADFYEHDPDLEMYDEREGFIFFEVAEGLYFEVRWGTGHGKCHASVLYGYTHFRLSSSVFRTA